MLEKTTALIEDVSELSVAIEDKFKSVTNEHLVKIALIYFSLDVETYLKEYFSKEKLISKFNNIRDFCNFYKNNFNNPDIDNLKAIYKKFGLEWPKLDDSEMAAYDNIIVARNGINHDPLLSLSINFDEIKGALKVAMKILKKLEDGKEKAKIARQSIEAL